MQAPNGEHPRCGWRDRRLFRPIGRRGRPDWKLRSFRRRLMRWSVRTVVGVPMVLLLVWLAVTQTALSRVLLLPAIERAVAMDIDGRRLNVNIDGSVRLRGGAFRIPAVPGEAGRVLRAEALVANIDVWSVLRGAPRVRSIEITDSIIRMSMHSETGRLNALDVELPQGQASTGLADLPQLRVHNARLEFGEHDDTGEFEVLRALNVDGALLPSRDREGQPGYDIRLTERRVRRAARPVVLAGRLDQRGVSLVLDEVALADWPPDAVPSRYRDFYAALALEGDIAETRFEASFDGGIVSRVKLAGVSISLPIPPTQGSRDAGARMFDVHGFIAFERDRVRAELSGIFEDLPYQVELETVGVATDAAFEVVLTTNNFELGENPGLLPFAPEVVRRRLASFSSPTATIDSRVVITRGSPVAGVAQPFDIRGWIDFRDGVASYEHFPYPLTEMSGLIQFDADKIDIVDIRGIGPTGARVAATGTISPPAPGAAVEIDIRATNVPVDSFVAAGLGPKRREVIEELFSRTEYRRLLDLGLVVPAAERARIDGRLLEIAAALDRDPDRAGAPELRAERAELLERAAIPVFDLGSTGQVDVRIRRQFGEVSPWENEIDVQFADAGVLPKRFPLPIIGEDVSLSITGSTARLKGGVFRGLRGGVAEIDATVDLGIGQEDADPQPRVTVRAEGVPLDGRLIAAIPDPAVDDLSDTERGANESQSIRRMLRDLRLSGLVDCVAEIGPLETGDLGFDVRVSVPRVVSSPTASAGATAAVNARLGGFLRVDQRGVTVELDGAARHIDPGGVRDAGDVSVRTYAVFADDGDPGSLEVFVEGTRLKLDAPIEDMVRVFTDDGFTAMRALRDRYDPSGRAAIAVVVSGPIGEPPTVEMAVQNFDRVGIDLLGGRTELTAPRGVAVVEALPSGQQLARMLAVRGDVRYNDAPAGRARFDGVTALTPVPPGAPEPELAIALTRADFGSGIVRGALDAAQQIELLDLYDRHQPFGPFDASLLVHPGEPGEGGVPVPLISGEVRPDAFSFERGDTIVTFQPVEGAVTFAPFRGGFEGVRVHERRWSATLDGDWVGAEDGSAEARLTFGVESDGLPPSLRSLLPNEILRLMADFEVDASGDVRVERGEVALARGPSAEDGEPGEPRILVTGLVRALGVSAVLGLPLRDAEVAMSFESDVDVARDRVRWRADIAAPELSYGGIALTRGRAQVSGGSDPDGVLPSVAPLISADCHAGRVSASTRVTPIDDERGRVEGVVRFSDMRAASLIRDLEIEAARTRGEPIPAVDPGATPDDTRGRLDGEIGFRLIPGDPSSLSGRGVMRVFGGEVISLPLIVPLIEVSNLRFPTGERIDFAQADFYMKGGEVVFEDLSAFSRSVRVIGFGTMAWPELELDLRFNSRAEARVPVLSKVLEGLRDELVTTRVRGTPGAPRITLEQFPRTRQALGRLFGLRATERDRRVAEMRERAELARERMQRASRSAGAPPTRREGAGEQE